MKKAYLAVIQIYAGYHRELRVYHSIHLVSQMRQHILSFHSHQLTCEIYVLISGNNTL